MQVNISFCSISLLLEQIFHFSDLSLCTKTYEKANSFNLSYTMETDPVVHSFREWPMYVVDLILLICHKLFCFQRERQGNEEATQDQNGLELQKSFFCVILQTHFHILSASRETSDIFVLLHCVQTYVCVLAFFSFVAICSYCLNNCILSR